MERCPGRKKGTSAPARRATSAIDRSSVETIRRSIALLAKAASIVQAINDLPPRSARFLPGSRFEPPRAVTRPRTPDFTRLSRRVGKFDVDPAPIEQDRPRALDALDHRRRVPGLDQCLRRV